LKPLNRFQLAVFIGITLAFPLSNLQTPKLIQTSINPSDSSRTTSLIEKPLWNRGSGLSEKGLLSTKTTISKSPASSIFRNSSPVLVQVNPGLVVLGASIFILAMAAIAVILVAGASIVRIKDDEVGIVFKRITLNPFHPKLQPGKRIALNKEEGYQADTLPPGRHFGYWPWMYSVRRARTIEVPQGQIALVIANEGKTSPNYRRLGKMVPCDDFQDARAFLMHEGEKGQQLGLLKAGRYGINLELFSVITQANAIEHGISPEKLKIHRISTDHIGVVTTNEGKLLPTEDGMRQSIAPVIPGHHCFQDAQEFISRGGYKGIQEEVLREGEWTLNPWFAEVEEFPVTKIHAGTVGVVIAQDGAVPNYTSANDLVEPYSNYRGIWSKALQPGAQLFNPKLLEIELVPTNKISLEWSNENKPFENYDSKLKAIQLYSKDGFDFEIDVKQVIRILPENAPKVIATVGSSSSHGNHQIGNNSGIWKYPSIRNLIIRVLRHIVTNEFLTAAKDFDALDFHERRSDIQLRVFLTIRDTLREQGVEAETTLINEIHLPPELQEILRNRAIREERLRDIDQDIDFQRRLQPLRYAEALTKLQEELAQQHQGVEIADLQAQADRLRGTAQADIIQAMVNVLGRDGYLTREQIQHIGDLTLPDNLFIGGSGDGAIDSLQTLMYPLLFGSSSPSTVNYNLSDNPRTILPSAEPPKILSASNKPRCPIVFLLDTSNAVPDSNIESWIEGISLLKRELMSDLAVAQRVDISVITYGGTPDLVQSFVPINQFNHFLSPISKTDSKNALAQAIELGLDTIKAQKTTYEVENKQYYKPWLVILGHTESRIYEHSSVSRLNSSINHKELLLLKACFSEACFDDFTKNMNFGLPPVLLDKSKTPNFFRWLASAASSLSSRMIGEKFTLPSMDNWQ
jgi:uncharacterized protein YegL/uncharacterized membrane protein YqiK